MVSFQHKLAQGLSARGVPVCYNLKDEPYSSILVIGGTRQIVGLWQARRRGVRLVQRLDGMNWLHRFRRTGVRHYLRSEYGNLLLAFIRARLADWIVYQSAFSQHWWESARLLPTAPSSVVYNGVDLGVYHPQGTQQRPEKRLRILLVEGSLMGGYEQGLESAVHLAEVLEERKNLAHSLRGEQLSLELMVVGRIAQSTQEYWSRQSKVPITWTGLVPAQRIPELARSAHLLYSADLNPACPNSVIEALACGLPVLAFDTGALPEMVPAGAGRVVPYGGNPWVLDPPDIPALVEGAEDIFRFQVSYRTAARLHAEKKFGLDPMVDAYLHILQDG
jgi:glycosyltransferase involved in cell wall biosynthesis